MIIANVSGLTGTAWTISNANGAIQKGDIAGVQYLTVTVGHANPPFTVLFNSSFGSRTATLTGVTSPDACCVYWLNADNNMIISQEATVAYPWASAETENAK